MLIYHSKTAPQGPQTYYWHSTVRLKSKSRVSFVIKIKLGNDKKES